MHGASKGLVLTILRRANVLLTMGQINVKGWLLYCLLFFASLPTLLESILLSDDWFRGMRRSWPAGGHPLFKFAARTVVVTVVNASRIAAVLRG